MFFYSFDRAVLFFLFAFFILKSFISLERRQYNIVSLILFTSRFFWQYQRHFIQIRAISLLNFGIHINKWVIRTLFYDGFNRQSIICHASLMSIAFISLTQWLLTICLEKTLAVVSIQSWRSTWVIILFQLQRQQAIWSIGSNSFLSARIRAHVTQISWVFVSVWKYLLRLWSFLEKLLKSDVEHSQGFRSCDLAVDLIVFVHYLFCI